MKTQKRRKEVNHKRLLELLTYYPETGEFYWNVGRGRVGKGQKAGTLMKSGYIAIQIDEVLYSGQRLAWFYTHQYFSENEIDHINRIRNDNRICNLREVTKSCNLMNAVVKKNNKTGVTGVSYNKISKRFVAMLNVNKVRYYLGTFNDLLTASIERHNAEIRYNIYKCNMQPSSAYKYIQNNL